MVIDVGEDERYLCAFSDLLAVSDWHAMAFN